MYLYYGRVKRFLLQLNPPADFKSCQLGDVGSILHNKLLKTSIFFCYITS